MNELASQATGGIVAMILLDALKGAGWFRWLSPESATRIKVAFGGLAAALTTIGVGLTFDWNFVSGGEVHAAIPGGAEILHNLIDFGRTWAMQEYAYRLTKR